MILRQFLHQDPVGVSYLLGCGGHASGAVVDPVGDLAPYLSAAEDAALEIKFVIDTHVHADHISAGRQLRTPPGPHTFFQNTPTSPFIFSQYATTITYPFGM